VKLRRFYICDPGRKVDATGDTIVAEVTTPEAAAGLMSMPGCEKYILIYVHPDMIEMRDLAVLYKQMMADRVFYLGWNCQLEPVQKIFNQLGSDLLFPLLQRPFEALVEEFPRFKAWMYPPALALVL
jgi:hypothetical protein